MPAEPVLIEACLDDWIDREVRLYQASTSFRSEADRAAMLAFFAKGRAVYKRLAQ